MQLIKVTQTFFLAFFFTVLTTVEFSAMSAKSDFMFVLGTIALFATVCVGWLSLRKIWR